MTWFKVDDGFWRHRKVRLLARDKLTAVGLWTLAGDWAADNIDTNAADGFVPWEVIEQWDPKRRHAKRLIEVGLWKAAEIGTEHGILFHDWADSNPTKATRDAEREAWRNRKAKQRSVPTSSTGMSHRDTHRDSRETVNGTHAGSPTGSHADVRYPVPSRPVVGGSVGGERPVGDRARNERPPDRCPKHANTPEPPPCGACADARRTAETFDDAELARAEAIRRDIEQAIADPRQRCDHGTDGGRFEHPVTGRSATCALCRTQQARDAS